jgi:hypothetical protein
MREYFEKTYLTRLKYLDNIVSHIRNERINCMQHSEQSHENTFLYTWYINCEQQNLNGTRYNKKG